MVKIGIITDSTCDLSNEYLSEKKIKLLPTRIIYSYGEFLDRIEIEPKEVYDNFVKEIPKTSMPSPDDFFKAVDACKAEGCTHIIAILVSSGLSGTFNMASAASHEIHDIPIKVIDSKSLSLGLGYLVMDAVKAAEEGRSYEEIITLIESRIQDTHVYFALETLKYLRNGGRIGYVEGTIAEMLNIKPVIRVEQSDGKYRTHKKARGMKKAIDVLKSVMDSFDAKKVRITAVHGDLPEKVEEILSHAKTKVNVIDYHSVQTCPVLGVHTGPGLIGFVLQLVE